MPKTASHEGIELELRLLDIIARASRPVALLNPKKAAWEGRPQRIGWATFTNDALDRLIRRGLILADRATTPPQRRSESSRTFRLSGHARTAMRDARCAIPIGTIAGEGFRPINSKAGADPVLARPHQFPVAEIVL